MEQPLLNSKGRYVRTFALNPSLLECVRRDVLAVGQCFRY